MSIGPESSSRTAYVLGSRTDAVGMDAVERGRARSRQAALTWMARDLTPVCVARRPVSANQSDLAHPSLDVQIHRDRRGGAFGIHPDSVALFEAGDTDVT